MKTLKDIITEGVLNPDNINTMDNVIDEQFPSIKDFKKHPKMTRKYIIWPCKRLCAENLGLIEEYFRAQTMINFTIVKRLHEITGISLHVYINASGSYNIEMFFEGIDRGNFTEIGVVIPNIEGRDYESLAIAKKAAYDFLLQFKNDRTKFSELFKSLIVAAKHRATLNFNDKI